MKKKHQVLAVLCSLLLVASTLFPVNVSAARAIVPAKVNITRISASPSRKVTLTWKKAPRATSYRIYYKYGKNPWKVVGNTSRTSFTHVSSSRAPLKGGVKYTYTVRGYNKSSRKLGPYDRRGRSVTVPLRINKLTLNKTALSFNQKGKTYQLSASISPRNATNKRLLWKTSNPKVATVNSSGKVTAVGNGTAYITVAARDGSGKTARCKVTVRISSHASTMANEIVKLTNKERTSRGLAPLKPYTKGQWAAMKRAKEISRPGHFSHTRPDGTICFSVLSEYNIQSCVSGENIARVNTPTRVVSRWMNSPGHRANILSIRYTHIGVGYYRYNGMDHWVQIFLTDPF